MKPAGPLRGIRRAMTHALDFVFYVAMFGVAGLAILCGLLGTNEMLLTLPAMHLGVAVALWPSAVAMNWILLRILRPRSWRHQVWKARVAGMLGAVLVWMGPSLVSRSTLSGKGGALTQVLGSATFYVQIYGLLVLFSNLAILAAWALPAAAGRPIGSSGPPSRID